MPAYGLGGVPAPALLAYPSLSDDPSKEIPYDIADEHTDG